MSGREEFDWDRMRREEDAYFSTRKPPPSLGEVMRRVPERIRKLRGDDEEVQRLRALPYAEYLETDHWTRLRDLAMERDGHECRMCRSRRTLNVHHLTYDRRGCELLLDLITLCRRCHEAQHNKAI